MRNRPQRRPPSLRTPIRNLRRLLCCRCVDGMFCAGRGFNAQAFRRARRPRRAVDGKPPRKALDNTAALALESDVLRRPHGIGVPGSSRPTMGNGIHKSPSSSTVCVLWFTDIQLRLRIGVRNDSGRQWGSLAATMCKGILLSIEKPDTPPARLVRFLFYPKNHAPKTRKNRSSPCNARNSGSCSRFRSQSPYLPS